jgi:ABC-2 type transport system permease protein
MASATLLGSTKSEWIKFRSVRSSINGALITVLLTIGISALVAVAVKSHWPHVHERHGGFDPDSIAVVGVFFAQFAFGVIGALFITSEYSSSSIRTSLAAVPSRMRLVFSKVIVLTISGFVIAEASVFAAFFTVMSIFHGKVPTVSITQGDVFRSVFLAGVYLTLLALIGFALGLLLRQSSICISVFVFSLLILPIITNFLPSTWQADMVRFEPSELGSAMMSTTPQVNHFSAYGSTFVLFLYVVALIGVGIFLFQKRDA